jgi:hypothetical protein
MQAQINAKFGRGSYGFDVGRSPSFGMEANGRRLQSALRRDRLCKGAAANVAVAYEDDPSNSRPIDLAKFVGSAENRYGGMEQ